MAAFGEEDGPEDDEEMRFLAAAIEDARLEQSKIDKEYEIQKAAIEEETRIQEEIEKKQISDMTAEEIRVNKIMMEVSIRRLEMKIAKYKELEKEREVARANHVFED